MRTLLAIVLVRAVMIEGLSKEAMEIVEVKWARGQLIDILERRGARPEQQCVRVRTV